MRPLHEDGPPNGLILAPWTSLLDDLYPLDPPFQAISARRQPKPPPEAL